MNRDDEIAALLRKWVFGIATSADLGRVQKLIRDRAEDMMPKRRARGENDAG